MYAWKMEILDHLGLIKTLNGGSTSGAAYNFFLLLLLLLPLLLPSSNVMRFFSIVKCNVFLIHTSNSNSHHLVLSSFAEFNVFVFSFRDTLGFFQIQHQFSSFVSKGLIKMASANLYGFLCRCNFFYGNATFY